MVMTLLHVHVPVYIYLLRYHTVARRGALSSYTCACFNILLILVKMKLTRPVA
ncbi:hypothetical protein P167DRAFT_54559 [Morchella conica CCBAS932]|uniref:Uncharacterized protein n=1 Tax=Morchella conica CCBAS932 TaxID=1392247 RepID=A0A3N4KVE0_9PEZI|nr:hypothetical protein P167DRAFT_54559 [Morchella conica CCBAS932]